MGFALAAVIAAVLCGLVLALVRWFSLHTIEEDPLVPEEPLPDLAEADLPSLPDGHQPPPGLSPLSPSERFLDAEVERGLRDLQGYLLDV